MAGEAAEAAACSDFPKMNRTGLHKSTRQVLGDRKTAATQGVAAIEVQRHGRYRVCMPFKRR